jgi:hypothetical protein
MSNLTDIEHRNARVEANKAWETSWTRRLVITVGTYIVAAAYLTALNVEKALLHALVPCGAYLLSTLSLPFIKSFWLKRIYKKAEEKP